MEKTYYDIAAGYQFSIDIPDDLKNKDVLTGEEARNVAETIYSYNISNKKDALHDKISLIVSRAFEDNKLNKNFFKHENNDANNNNSGYYFYSINKKNSSISDDYSSIASIGISNINCYDQTFKKNGKVVSIFNNLKIFDKSYIKYLPIMGELIIRARDIEKEYSVWLEINMFPDILDPYNSNKFIPFNLFFIFNNWPTVNKSSSKSTIIKNINKYCLNLFKLSSNLKYVPSTIDSIDNKDSNSADIFIDFKDENEFLNSFKYFPNLNYSIDTYINDSNDFQIDFLVEEKTIGYIIFDHNKIDFTTSYINNFHNDHSAKNTKIYDKFGEGKLLYKENYFQIEAPFVNSDTYRDPKKDPTKYDDIPKQIPDGAAGTNWFPSKIRIPEPRTLYNFNFSGKVKVIRKPGKNEDKEKSIEDLINDQLSLNPNFDINDIQIFAKIDNYNFYPVKFAIQDNRIHLKYYDFLIGKDIYIGSKRQFIHKQYTV